MKPLIDQEEGVRLAAGNPSLYLHMLSRFAQDPSMKRLTDAFARSDAQEAYLHAHTLKGLSAQLALPALNSEAAQLCTRLREGRTLPDALPASLLSAYRRTLEAIAEFDRIP
ncbi:MAG: Hpt domain-containing protein [Clostridia bacterium]|nr:Hpt domain-containing protein [Clostridia bacterium]